MAVDDVIAEVSQRIHARLPELTRSMTDFFVAVIPEFRHDEVIRRLMIASTSSNLEAACDILAHQIPVADITVPAAAAEYARRFAQHGLALEGLLRAYRLGETMFLRWGLEELAAMPLSAAEVLAVTTEFSVYLERYIDQVVLELIDIYESERRLWDSSSGQLRVAQLRLVMDDPTVTQEAAELLLQSALSGHILGAVLRAEPHVPDPARVLQIARRALHAAVGREPDAVLVDERTMWAWMTADTPLAADQASLTRDLQDIGGVIAGLGLSRIGLAGFRVSLREASRACDVQTRGGVPGPVVSSTDVGLTSLLLTLGAGPESDLRAWMDSVLGGLAAHDEATARLRETVEILLACDGSYTDAAGRLYLHKNTVRYRANKAEELRGAPLSERRLDLEVALRLSRQLGPAGPTA